MELLLTKMRKNIFLSKISGVIRDVKLEIPL
jgi:hypothetical protein